MKKHKYDIIIYTSCLIAIILLISTLKDNPNSYSLKEDEPEIIESLTYEEPKELIEFNKELIIKDYLNNIYNRTIIDDNLSPIEIHSWQSYTISNITYIKPITKDYYEYKANINSENISNGYRTITFYIAKSNNSYIVKTSK